MKTIFSTLILAFAVHSLIAQYDNSEKFTILGGFTATGSEFVFYSDNVYGGNVQLVYDVLKIQEGANGTLVLVTASHPIHFCFAWPSLATSPVATRDLILPLTCRWVIGLNS
jgi:hypothetical protein